MNPPNMFMSGGPPPPPMLTPQSFAEAVANLPFLDVVRIEHIDPIVLYAQAELEASRARALDVVGVIEAQILRAPRNKYYVYLVVDAITRTFADYCSLFARNMEAIFTEAYLDSDETNRFKLLRMLTRYWMEQQRFEPLLLQRLQAAVDPSYDGPALYELPAYTAPEPLPPPPPPQPSHNNMSSSSPPPLGISPQLWSHAQRKLDEYRTLLIKSDPTLPQGVFVDLAQLATQNPVLYQWMLDQAYAELQSQAAAWAAVQQPHQQQFSSYFPSSSSGGFVGVNYMPPVTYGGMATLPPTLPFVPPIPTSRPITASPTPANSLAELNQRNVMERTSLIDDCVIDLSQAVVAATNAPKPLSAITMMRRDQRGKTRNGVLLVRRWMVDVEEWKQGHAHTIGVEQFMLFGELVNVRDTSSLNVETTPMVNGGDDEKDVSSHSLLMAAGPRPDDPDSYVVIKDDRWTECPLSGTKFETFYSNEEGSWMYKRAIRPNPPDGPIYSIEAWWDHEKALANGGGGGVAALLPSLDGGGEEPVSKRVKV